MIAILLLREINSGEIKVLNIKHKIPKRLENMWVLLCNLSVGQDLLKVSPNPYTKMVLLINVHKHGCLYTYVHISVQIQIIFRKNTDLCFKTFYWKTVEIIKKSKTENYLY